MPICNKPLALLILGLTPAFSSANATDGELDCFRQPAPVAEPQIQNQPLPEPLGAGPLPREQEVGRIHYMTGGIGEESASAMRAIRQRYPVAITFALRDGGRNQFTANVGAVIEDASDVPLLSLITEGPYLYVALPPGEYRLTAQEPRMGPTKQLRFRVERNRHIDLLVLWQVQP